MIENDAALDERAEELARVARRPVISVKTKVIGSIMLAVLLLGAALDYLAWSGRLVGADQYALAGFMLAPLALAAIILPIARGFDHGPVRTQWLFFGLGMLSVGVGGLIFVVLYLVTGEDPYPSVGDVFTLIGYGLFAAGLLTSIKSYKGLLDIRIPLFVSVGISAVVMALVWIGVIGPYVIGNAGDTQSTATRVFNALYPILDTLVMFAPALTLGLLVSKLGSGRLAWPAWFVVAGAGVLAIIDTAFAYATYLGAHRTPLIDAGYAAAPMLIAFAALVAWDVYHS